MENEVDTINLPRKEDLLAWLAWLVAVIFLLLWDVWKAWKRRAPWIPGQALVLSAFITELLFFIDCSHISVDSGSRYQTEEVEAILVKNQLVIDSRRVMMCVLIAYLLPGMARSCSITGGSNLAALACSITFHVVFELRSIWKVEKRNESLSALAASSFAIILILAIIYLLLLLIRAVMIGRTIRRLISQRIPSAISCCCPPDGTPRYNYINTPSCNDIRDHVLKCWIVVRFSQPDYVLVRTGVCSTAFPVVTVCIGVHVINRIYVHFTDNESLNSGTKGTLVQLVITGQIVIVVIGWIVLLVRWVTSERQGNIYGMSLQDLKSELKACFIGLFVRDKRIREKRIRDMNKKIRDIQSLLWNPRHWVKKLFQIFSMQYPPHWLSIIKQKLSNNKTRVSASVSEAEVRDGQFSMYEETLNMLLIPGESAWELWKANQWGFRKVKRYIDQGHEDGKRSPSELICLLKLGTVPAEDEADRGTAEHLRQANGNSWKRTAVSLIHFMIYYYEGSDASAIEDASVIENAMQCYIQGWEYTNWVDGLDKEAKSLGRQADGEFDSLQHSWNKRAQPGMLQREIKEPLTQLRERRYYWGSMDVAKSFLLGTWSIIRLLPEINEINRLPKINEVNRLPEINEINRQLAIVYFLYMTEAVNIEAFQKYSKLAEEGMEEEILDVAFLAAKAQGVLDKVREENNTGKASTSSHIPTGTEKVFEGNDPKDTDQDRLAHPSKLKLN